MRNYISRKLGDHSITRSADLADFIVALRRTPHPGVVNIRDNKDSFRVLLYSYYAHCYRVGGPPKAALIFLP